MPARLLSFVPGRGNRVHRFPRLLESNKNSMGEQHQNFPNIFEALLLVVGLILIELLVAAIAFEADFLTDVGVGDFAGFITVLGNGVLFIGLMAYKRIDYRALFHPTRNSVIATIGVVTLPIVLLVPGLVILAGAFNSLVIWLLPMSAEELAQFDEIMAAGIVSVLFSCLAAPVLEEMLFRGVILRSFLLQYSRTKAILWSSAIFGIAHLNVYQLASAFAIGIVAGWLYERCRSLWPCILLHAAYNATVTVMYNEAMNDEAAALMNSGAFTAAAFAAAIVGGMLLLRILGGPAPSRPSR